MARIYHRAIVEKSGKRLVFRLWRTGQSPAAFKVIADNTPDNLMFCIKNTSGDYYLSAGANGLLTSGAPEQRPFMVLFDAFREFDGWGRLLCYPRVWKDRLAQCAKAGVRAVNVWGPWSPGCIWPDEERGYLIGPEVPKSWRGLWSDYRIFLNGFTPAQANVYLFSRLAWDPAASADEITHDWAALHFGTDNAPKVVRALNLSQDLWLETFLRRTHPCYTKWTMIFSPREQSYPNALKHNSLDDVLASNARCVQGARKILDLADQLDAESCPDRDAAPGLRIAAEKTMLFFETFAATREAWFRTGLLEQLTGAEREEQLREIKRVCLHVRQLLPRWETFPQEAVDWRITQADPKLVTAPYWMGNTSVAQFVAELEELK